MNYRTKIHANPLVQRLLQNPAVLLALILLVALIPRLILMPMSGHFPDLQRHYQASQFIIDRGLFEMYDSPIGINHPPIGVGLYAGSTWAWFKLGGDITTPYNPDDGWQVAALKVSCLLFELALIVLVFFIVWRYAGAEWAAFTALAFAFSPGHLAIIAGKGQTDSIFSFFLVLTLFLLKQRRPHWAWAAYAFGWLAKFQSIMILPILVIFTWRRYGWRTLISSAVLFGIIIGGGMLPFVLHSGEDALVPYGHGSVDLFPYITNTAYNVWYWVSGADPSRALDSTELIAGVSYFQAGMLLFSLVTALICLRVLLLPGRDDEYLVAAAAGTAFFMLPTQIHSRYLYAGLLFLALALWQRPRLIVLYLGFVITFTQNTFDTMHLGSGLVYYPAKLFFWNPTLSAVANTVLFVILLAVTLWPLWHIRRELPQRLADCLRANPGRG